jgi:beta-lysine 5,6-aminomutase alpha subunit
MKRPPDRGKGLDGVARKELTYHNPAMEILDAGSLLITR